MFAVAPSLPSPVSLDAPRRRLLRSRSLPRASATAHASAAPARLHHASLYDVLGVPVGATGPEIKAAYRRMALVCHPDVVGGASADEFMRVHAAYATLSEPDKRAEYDGLVLGARMGAAAAAAAAAFSRSYTYSASSPPPCSGFSRRSWETDQCW